MATKRKTSAKTADTPTETPAPALEPEPETTEAQAPEPASPGLGVPTARVLGAVAVSPAQVVTVTPTGGISIAL